MEYKIEDIIQNPTVLGVIYVVENQVNGKVYVGQQKIVGKTVAQVSRYLGSGTLITKAVQKYGKLSFKKKYVDYALTSDDLNQKEVHWISFLGAQDRRKGYNLLNGGQREGLSYGADDRIVWVTNGLENLTVLESQAPEYEARGYHRGTNLKGRQCTMNDSTNEFKVYFEDVPAALDQGFIPGRILGNEYVEKVWASYKNQVPMRMGKDNMPKEFSVIPDCPICHAPNSPDNFCCSEEHWDQFEADRLTKMSEAQSAFVASTWEDESVSANRKANISRAYAVRRELQARGKLDKYLWVSDIGTKHELQVPSSSVPEYLEKGYELGRLSFSEEARANMGREAGFKWSAESIAKREETRAIRHEARMKDPEYAEAYRRKKSESQLKGSGKKKETWANKKMSDEWKRMKSETTKAGFAKKKAEALARGECVQKKWVHRGSESRRILATEFDMKLAEGWEPGRGKLR